MEHYLSADFSLNLKVEGGAFFNSIAIIRVRNEELILEDTLAHLSLFVDAIVALDDSSTDSTPTILRESPHVIAIITNRNWLPEVQARLEAETSHRQMLLEVCRKHVSSNWIMCVDADERFEGNIRELFAEDLAKAPDYVRVSLFDAYMTPFDFRGLSQGQKLLGARKYFGVERRDIVMIFRNVSHFNFIGLDSREPAVSGRGVVMYKCQHYGKSISRKQWDDTCRYYINHFPWDPYGKKWSARIGKSVHLRSDFGTRLEPWSNKLFDRAVIIHPPR